MVNQKHSRSERRIKVKTPSGRVVIHYKPRRKHLASCSGCGTRLFGVSYGLGVAASERAPSRPFGGVLCSRCSRQAVKERVVR